MLRRWREPKYSCCNAGMFTRGAFIARLCNKCPIYYKLLLWLIPRPLSLAAPSPQQNQLVPALLKSACFVLQRYTAQTTLVRLLENDKCELRAAVLGLLVFSLLHLDTRFFRRVSRVPNTSSRTVSYGQKPLPYNTSAKGKLLANGERSSRPSLSPQ